MRTVLASLILTLIASVAPAGETVPVVHSQTSVPGSSRFEILQSPLAVRNTFRLDKYTGRIHQIAKDKDGTFAWQEMVVHGRPVTASPTAVRFQLFSSGLAVRHTYLLDTSTGATWQLKTVSESKPDGTAVTEEDQTAEWFPVTVFNFNK